MKKLIIFIALFIFSICGGVAQQRYRYMPVDKFTFVYTKVITLPDGKEKGVAVCRYYDKSNGRGKTAPTFSLEDIDQFVAKQNGQYIDDKAVLEEVQKLENFFQQRTLLLSSNFKKDRKLVFIDRDNEVRKIANSYFLKLENCYDFVFIYDVEQSNEMAKK